MLCVCVAHVVVKADRDARVAEGQAERVALACVRAARLTDLPFLLGRQSGRARSHRGAWRRHG